MDKYLSYAPSAFMTEPERGQKFDAAVLDGFSNAFSVARALKPTDDYFLDRVGSAIFYRLPHLLSIGRDLSTMNAVEIGCGRGTKAVCLAPLFKSYRAFDLNPVLIKEAVEFGRLTSSKAEFSTANGADVLDNPKSVGLTDRIDCVIIYAVFEHLTLRERETTLRAARSLLDGHGLLIVCEAPNRLIREDPHSSAIPFFQMLPYELARRYIDRSPRDDAKQLLNCTEEQLYRFGAGVSYHEFDLFMEDKNGALPAIVGGAWDLWAAADEPIRLEEAQLETYFQEAGIRAHPSFARYWIDVIFDFSRTMTDDACKRPVIMPPAITDGLAIAPGQRWTLPSYRTNGADLHFDNQGRQPLYAQIDLNSSNGSFAIFDDERSIQRSFEIDHLRKSRFPRWHHKAQLDLSAFAGSSRLRIQSIDGTIATDGIVAS